MKRIKPRITVSAHYQDNPDLVFLIENMDGCLASSEARILKRDRTSIVTACQVGKRHFVIKQYYPHHRMKELSRSFRKSKARRTWEGAHFLKSIGVAAVEPAALVEYRIFFLNFRSYFIGNLLEGVNARFYLLDPDISPEAKIKAVGNIFASLKKIHAGDATHGDTKDVNIFIRDGQAHWLDLDDFNLARSPLRFLTRKKKEKDWWLLMYNWRNHPGLHQLFIHELKNHFSRDHIFKILRQVIERRKEKLPVKEASPGKTGPPATVDSIQSLSGAGRSEHWRVLPHWTEMISSSPGESPYQLRLYPIMRVKRCFGQDRARKEADNARMMLSAGFYAPRVIHDAGVIGGYEATVSEISHEQTFRAYLQRRGKFRENRSHYRAVLLKIGEEIGRMHGCGMFHGDLRLDSIFIDTKDGNPKISFLCSALMRHYRKEVPLKKVTKDLAMMDMELRHVLSRCQRLRMYTGYENARGMSCRRDRQQLIAGILKYVRKNAFFNTVMLLVKKTRIQNTDSVGGREVIDIYTPEDSDPAFWVNIARKCGQKGLPGLEAVPSSSTAGVQAGYIGDLPYKIFLKSFYPRNRRDHAKQIFRSSRAYRDFKGVRTAASRGLRVPDVCCVIEKRKYGMRRLSFTVTREVEQGLSLGRLLEKLQREGDFGTRRRVIRELGREMAKWHGAGMQHGDARDTNILCRLPCGHEPPVENPDDHLTRNMEFTWLDNERTRPVFRKYEFIRNLVQLNMTRSGITLTDRMRFWKAYWADAGHLYSPRSAETVLAKIAARTRRRWKVRGWL